MKTFSERVVELALMIPKGRITTYGRIARAAGGGGQSARSVTAILARAKHRGVKNIPFHRIVRANGRVWLDHKHCDNRLPIYKKEQIEINKNGIIKNFSDVLFEFK